MTSRYAVLLASVVVCCEQGKTKYSVFLTMITCPKSFIKAMSNPLGRMWSSRGFSLFV